MENFNDIIKSNQLTLVDFYATWCGPCKMMHPVLEQLKDEFGDNIRILKIDVDKNEDVSAAYRIQSVPTLMLFRNGQVLWRQSGAMSLNVLKNIKVVQEPLDWDLVFEVREIIGDQQRVTWCNS